MPQPIHSMRTEKAPAAPACDVVKLYLVLCNLAWGCRCQATTAVIMLSRKQLSAEKSGPHPMSEDWSIALITCRYVLSPQTRASIHCAQLLRRPPASASLAPQHDSSTELQRARNEWIARFILALSLGSQTSFRAASAETRQWLTATVPTALPSAPLPPFCRVQVVDLL